MKHIKFKTLPAFTALFTAIYLITSSAYADETSSQNNALGNALGSVFGAVVHTVRAATNPNGAGAGQASGLGVTNTAIPSLSNSYSVPPMSDEDKQLMANGMWHDPRTGLIWMRCDLGDIWTGSACQQDFSKGYSNNSWQRDKAVVKISQLTFGGYNDWRLPTIEDLYGLYNIRKCIGSNYRTTGNEVQIPKNGGNGTITVPHNCALEDGVPTPKIDSTVFLAHFDQAYLSASDDNSIPTSNNISATFHPYNLWTIDFKGNNIITRSEEANAENVQPIGYVLVVRGGHSTGEYEHVLGLTQSLNVAKQQKEVADAAAAKRIHDINLQKENAANQRLAAWESKVQIGDRVIVPAHDGNGSFTPGMVIQDNGQLVLVQTTGYGNLWVKRSELRYP